MVNLDIRKLPHLDLTSTALYDFHVVKSDVLLAMESQSFHHLDGCLQTQFLESLWERFNEQKLNSVGSGGVGGGGGIYVVGPSHARPDQVAQC